MLRRRSEGIVPGLWPLHNGAIAIITSLPPFLHWPRCRQELCYAYVTEWIACVKYGLQICYSSKGYSRQYRIIVKRVFPMALQKTAISAGMKEGRMVPGWAGGRWRGVRFLNAMGTFRKKNAHQLIGVPEYNVQATEIFSRRQR